MGVGQALLSNNQILFFNATDFKLCSSTYFILLFPQIPKYQGWIGHLIHFWKKVLLHVIHKLLIKVASGSFKILVPNATEKS